MAATYTTTARNALRALLNTSLVADVSAGFLALAEDVDKKMLSWWEGTLAARPAAGQTNRLYKTTDTGVIFHDTGAAWEPLMPGLAVRTSPGNITAVSGDRVEMTATGTVTLPAVTVNSVVEVWNAEGVTTIAGAGGAKISGDFITAAASITLTKFQHVLLVADGGGWLIAAGEPKPEQVYAKTEYTQAQGEAGVEPSATRRAYVILNTASTEFGSSLSVGGVGVEVQSKTAFLWVPPGQKWKVNKATSAFTVLL